MGAHTVPLASCLTPKPSCRFLRPFAKGGGLGRLQLTRGRTTAVLHSALTLFNPTKRKWRAVSPCCAFSQTPPQRWGLGCSARSQPHLLCSLCTRDFLPWPQASSSGASLRFLELPVFLFKLSFYQQTVSCSKASRDGDPAIYPQQDVAGKVFERSAFRYRSLPRCQLSGWAMCTSENFRKVLLRSLGLTACLYKMGG